MTERGGAEGQPLYRLIKLEITRALSAGKLRPGDALPTERELAAQYGVSIGTIRRAMDELVAEHIVVRQQGRGTFLREFSQDHRLNHFWRIHRSDGSREVPIVQTLSFRRAKADAEVAEALQVARGSPVIHIVNLLILGGRPILFDDVTLPQSMFPGLTEEALIAREGTMYGLYQSAFGVSVIRTMDRVLARAADAEAATRLEVAQGTPVLEIIRIAYTFDAKPVELRRTIFLTDGYEYRHTIGGNAA